MSHKKLFSKRLLYWHHNINEREMPWKGERDPYKIWLSEIILQQTRTLQGLPYYLRFVTIFPAVADLAMAEESYVFKQWQGLGYYSRCRNLLKTARIIHEEYNGIFPQDYNKLLSLPGVGSYTAAAISSFAFDMPYPVIDGNVYRVLARVFGIELPIDTTEGIKHFKDVASEVFDRNHSRDYNQAIMDLGATVCMPKQAECTICPFQNSCIAYANNLQALLPFKSKKISVKERHFHYFIIEDEEGNIYMEQRVNKDIWQDLFQPFLIETNTKDFPLEELNRFFPFKIQIDQLGNHRQKLTHQLIHTYWYHFIINKKHLRLLTNGRFYSKEMLQKLAIPKSVFTFYKKNDYF